MKQAVWPLILAGIVLNVWISARVNPLAYTGGRSRDDADRLRRNSSSIAMMIGEFRTSMSDIMFIKTERYLHGGIGYAPHHSESVLSAEDLSEEVEEHQGELGIPDDDEEDDHAGTPTLIPTREQDFRGFVGKLHREVKPWRDPELAHIHTDGRELLPWFRAMTLTDPGYVRGFVAGSFWLQMQDPDAALEFVEEGLRNNPDAFELYVSRGFLLLRQVRTLRGIVPENPDDEVRPIMEDALAAFSRGAELALLQRPPDGEEGPGWSGYQENDARAAANMTVTLTRMLGDPDGAMALALRFLETYAESIPLQRALDL